MYGRLGDAELRGRGADRRFVFDYIHGQITGALFDICTHRHHSPFSRTPCIWPGTESYESGAGESQKRPLTRHRQVFLINHNVNDGKKQSVEEKHKKEDEQKARSIGGIPLCFVLLYGH